MVTMIILMNVAKMILRHTKLSQTNQMLTRGMSVLLS
jgi:hypothetical protein